MKTKIKNIRIEGRRWFDRVNGNTYHATRVFVDGRLEAVAQFQYGYGDQYVWSGWLALVEKLKLPVKKYSGGSTESAWQWCRDRHIDFSYDHADVLKRDVVAWGKGGR